MRFNIGITRRSFGLKLRHFQTLSSIYRLVTKPPENSQKPTLFHLERRIFDLSFAPLKTDRDKTIGFKE